MKKTGLTLLLVAIVCALIFWIWSMLSTPIKFQSHFAERSKAVIEKEEYIIKLVQGYRDSNPDKKFTTNWDELIDFALNGTMEYRSQIYDENNLKNAEILAELRKDKNWKNERVVVVAARDTIFDDELGVCRLTEEEIEAEYNKIAEAYNIPAEQVKSMVAADDIKADMLVANAMKLVKDTAVVEKAAKATETAEG